MIMQRSTSSSLPPLDPDSAQHSARTALSLRQTIEAAGGWIPFDQWMSHALYAPGLGYYAAGATKLGSPEKVDARGIPIAEGDFVTAPELTPLFGYTIARQVIQVLEETNSNAVLEFGAGTGALAESILQALDKDHPGCLYYIIEVSADLRARQQERLVAYGNRVQWLDTLPTSFSGCVLANEVLDAMPVSLFCWGENATVLERGVSLSPTGDFIWQDKPAPTALADMVSQRMPCLPGYVSEINLHAQAWIAAMSKWLTCGAAILFDYGFPRNEYYHPQRAGGTLMCHLHHHAHADPFVAPGAQDITAHVDFTAMADAAFTAGLDIYGYTSQARFLMNAGLAELLGQHDPADVRNYAQTIAPVQKLLSEAEMGELFKVLAVGRGLTSPLIGFSRGDRLATL